MIAERFGSYTFPQYNGAHQLDTAQAASGIVTTASGQAVDAYGSDDAPAQPLQFTVSFYVLASTSAALDTALDTVRALTRKRDVLWALMADGTRRWITARCMGVRVSRDAKQGVYQPVELSFEAAWPFWQAEDEIGATGYYSDDDLTTVGADDWLPTAASGTAQTVYHDGNVYQYDVLWEFMPSGAALTAVQVDNSTTGYTFSWAGSVSSGNTLRIDCGAETVYNEATEAYSGFTRPTTKAQWFALAPGANTITVTYTVGGGGTLTYGPRYYPAYA